jgi:hypothetical protein
VLFVHAETPSVSLQPDSTTGADVPVANA